MGTRPSKASIPNETVPSSTISVLADESKFKKAKPSKHRRSPQLPNRLVIVILNYVTSVKDIARLQSICRSWRVTRERLDPLMKARYLNDWESETAESNAIAIEGKDTSWLVRYKRRAIADRYNIRFFLLSTACCRRFHSPAKY